MARSRVYISGPMTGIDKSNYPAFNYVANRLRKIGYTVYNPADNFGGLTGLPRGEYMRLDFQNILLSDFVCVIPGWEKSTGAKAEVLVAHECAIPVFEFDDNADLGMKPMTGRKVTINAEKLTVLNGGFFEAED